MATYFPSGYFAPCYFGALESVVYASATAMSATDHVVFSHIASSLVATREFVSVAFPEEAEQLALNAQSGPALTIIPRTWEEVECASAGTLVRTVTYRLELSVRTAYARNGIARLSRLGNLCQNLLDAADMGGLTLSARTRLSSGGYESDFPESRLTMHGVFAYLVQRDRGRDTLLYN